MAESARGFALVVERRRIMLSTVFVLSVEDYSGDGHNSPFCTTTILADCLELADLVVDEDV